MKKVSTQPYKGARDFYPEDKRFQQWMFDKWKRVVERYGYVEYDAPILEPTDIYLMKGSEEIVKEQTYTFKDRGDRSVTIRTEMTPTVSRMVAGRRQELAYPARWYSIPGLWRYERMQRGRGREFYQLNVDVFGIDSMQAELEMVQIMDGIFQTFKAKRSTYVIKLNSRVLVNAVLVKAGVKSDNVTPVIRLIDRMNKMSTSEFAGRLDEITGDKSVSAEVVEFLQSKSIEELDSSLAEMESIKSLNAIIGTCKELGISNIEFDTSLMRGFDYYTDIVFEAFDTDPENNRSMFGGGRYDGLVAQFGADPIPTVGFGMGDMTFQNFLESHGLIPDLKLSNDLTVVIRDQSATNAAFKAAKELREIGVNTAVDYSGRKIDKQLKNAIKSGVRYVLFVGEENANEDLYTLKDMKTGKEEKHSLARIVSIVKDSRK